MLILFDSAATNTPVAVNAARVTKVVSDKNDAALSVIFFASNDYVLVRGTLNDVVAALSG